MNRPRIVSLLPSATEIVCALGLEDRLVGISHSCDYPPSIADRPRLSRPRADLAGLSSGQIDEAIRAALQSHGSVYEIAVAAIHALEPDLILTQGICDVCAVPRSQVLEAIEGSRIVTLDAHDLSAIIQSVRDVGAATGVMDRAELLVSEMQRRIDAVRTHVAGRPRPRVLALEWLDPPYVPGHWVPELIAAAGGHLLAGTARKPSYRMAWSELRQLDPDVVVIMPCGFNLEASQREAELHKSELNRIGGRVECVDASSFFSRSGPRVVNGIEILASVLHHPPPSSPVLHRPIFPA